MIEEQRVRAPARFRYVDFLWQEIREIRQRERERNCVLALQYALSLVPYLSSGIKDGFRKKANRIKNTMAALPAKVEGSDLFVEDVVRNRVLQKYAKAVLPGFIDELSSEIDRRGYMEEKPMRPRAKGPGRLKI